MTDTKLDKTIAPDLIDSLEYPKTIAEKILI